MYVKHLYTTILFLLLSVVSAVAQNNTLSIPDVSVAQGRSISLPIQLDNTADVVAVQFTLTLPNGLTLTPSTAELTERAEGLTVTMNQIADNKYMAMVYSMSNECIKGRAGKLMSVKLNAASSLYLGAELPLTLSDVVIGARNGANLTTGFSAGKVIITKSPDLEVGNVTFSSSSVSPNGTLSVKWNVTNVGGASSEGGWREEIFLESPTGVTKSIGTVYYNNSLSAGGVTSRNADITLPNVIGIDDLAKVKVKLTAATYLSEPSGVQDNNTAVSSSSVTISKLLTLTPNIAEVDEATMRTVRFNLSRSGSKSTDETFVLSSSADSRVTLPSSVTIKAGQSGVYFYAQMKANKSIDSNSEVNFNLSGCNYPAVNGKLVINDDTYPNLSISSATQDVEEGKTITLTINADRAPSEDVEVKLSNDFSSRFIIPSSIILQAGKNFVDVIVEAKDDDTPYIEEVVTFTASAAKYNSGSTNIVLIDNDIPTLQFSVTPDAVSEAAGPMALTATLRRTDNKDKKITIKLSDDSNGAIYYSRQSIEMAPGVEEATFTLGPVDNTIVDGERHFDITAAVYIAACSCNAGSNSGGVVTAPLTIYDNDGPTLTMTSSASVLKEGGEMTVNIARNAEISKSQVVNLVCDHPSDIICPATITIPAGVASVSFTVKSKSNGVSGDSFTALLTASATGFGKVTTWFTVSDQTLPDVQIPKIELSSSHCIPEGTITVNATISNTGSYPMPEQTKVNFYSNYSSAPIASAYLQEALAPGSAISIEKNVTVPKGIGTYRVYAMINESKVVKELLYTNNTSQIATFDVVSPISSVTISADKKSYNRDESILISGSVVGAVSGNKEVEIYVINGSYRHVIKTTTNADNTFSEQYTPYEGQIGHFAIGVCYPGEGLNTEMSSFDVYGIKAVNNSAITCNMLVGDQYKGAYSVSNPAYLSLTGVKVEVVSKPENYEVEVKCPTIINGNTTFNVEYTLKTNIVTEGKDWEQVELNIVSNEGVSLPTTLYVYCRNKKGQLTADITRIKTTMVKDASRDYAFTLTNIGSGETGKVTLDLPSWMTSVTPREMGSMNEKDSTTVILRFSPTPSMQLNVPVTGTIGINCTNGNGISLPYCIEPVSESEGVMIIDVCDENTYYTQEGPHLAGAEVTVTHPTTGALIAKGITGSNGRYSISLPEGYYTVSVTADRHTSYRNNLLIDPGTENITVVDLSIQAITIDWKVEETEVEDKYEVVTTVKYETNVPVPVIEAIFPDDIPYDELKNGNSVMMNVVLTNKGLITAKEVNFVLEDAKGLEFEYYLDNGFQLAPQQSVVMPVLIKPIESESGASVHHRLLGHDGLISCTIDAALDWVWDCGQTRKEAGMKFIQKIGDCANDLGLGGSSSSGGGGGGSLGPGLVWYTDTPKTSPKKPVGPYITPIQHIDSSEHNNIIIPDIPTNCNPCLSKLAKEISKYVIKNIPIIKTVLEYEDKVVCAIDVVRGYPACVVKQIPHVKEVIEWVEKLVPVYETVQVCLQGTNLPQLPDLPDLNPELWSKQRKASIGSRRRKASGEMKLTDISFHSKENLAHYPEAVLNAYEASYIIAGWAKAQAARALNIMGNEAWTEATPEDMEKFANDFDLWLNEGMTDEEFTECRPECISIADMQLFIQRVRNTEAGNNDENSIDLDLEKECSAMVNEVNEHVVNLGYGSLIEYTDTFTKECENALENNNTVCASITLQFSQSTVMTRQAFRGTLSVLNGNASKPMKDVKLALEVKDSDGNVATTHEFQITPESLTDFEGELNLDSGWSLAQNSTGVATILFIPTKYAAPNAEKVYNFGGTISYIDPYTDLVVTRELSPVTLTVKPSPELDLTYFMQRDIIGDDPLTEEIEPCKEAEFSLLIHNVGNGDATKVQMVTNQPEVVENKKGLSLDFELISSQLNGGDKTLALGGSVATDFGTIPAKGTTYAQWWIKSSLLGHFTEYNVEATHVTSYGNPDLSLLNNVTIHELIRSIDVEDGTNKLKGFMTNDIHDDNDTPDMLYLTDGNVESVATAANVSITKMSATNYELVVKPSSVGWNYGNIIDPTYGVSELKSITRKSDGKTISMRNMWQTDRTLRDSKDPLYENRIHFVDKYANIDTETYELVFEPTPEVLLSIVSIEGAPEEGTLGIEPVASVNVMFSKQIDPATFTSDDFTFAVQGIKQDASKIAISSLDNKTFMLDFSALNADLPNGYYNLSIQTAEITDEEGFHGKDGKTCGWVMFRGGFVALKKSVFPQLSGQVTHSVPEIKSVRLRKAEAYDDKADYGSTLLFSATPAEGYQFTSWTLNGEVISTEQQFEYTALSDIDITANFSKKSYAVTINKSEGGGTNDCAGYYSHGDKLTITAQPSEFYTFTSWTVDGKPAGTSPQLTVTVDHPVSITPNFTREIYQQKMTLAQGWNWVSSYVQEALPVSELFLNVNRIVSQLDEVVKDPQYGMIGGFSALTPTNAYKIEASYATMKTFNGHLLGDEYSSINLRKGWNWIGYPWNTAASLSDAITGAREGDRIVAQTGFAEYADGYWEGSLNALTPGLGYLYQTAAMNTISIATPAANAQSNSNKAMKSAGHGIGNIVDIHKYPNAMSVTANLFSSTTNIGGDNYIIYAMAGDECRGMAQCTGSNYYLSVYGDAPVEITFVIEDTDTGESFIANESLLFCNDAVGSRKAPYRITVGEASSTATVLTDGNLKIYSLEGILLYDNADRQMLRNLKRGIYIVNGHKYLVR